MVYFWIPSLQGSSPAASAERRCVPLACITLVLRAATLLGSLLPSDRLQSLRSQAWGTSQTPVTVTSPVSYSTIS